MNKQLSIILWLSTAVLTLFAQIGNVKAHERVGGYKSNAIDSAADRNTVLGIINTVVKASSTFDINAVSDLYTPNALVADEEPPFSWNGPTAGVQWVSTVEKTVKDVKLKGFKGKVGRISVYLQTDESIYLVIPVDYTGEIKGERFDEDGVFTFIFRLVSGKWLIKSQVWVAKKGL